MEIMRITVLDKGFFHRLDAGGKRDATFHIVTEKI